MRYGHSTPGAPVEFVNLRVATLGRITTGAVPHHRPTGEEDPSLGARGVVFAGETHETRVLHRPRIAPGMRHDGPVIVEEDSSTTIVPPDYGVEVDEAGNLLITRSQG